MDVTDGLEISDKIQEGLKCSLCGVAITEIQK